MLLLLLAGLVGGIMIVVSLSQDEGEIALSGLPPAVVNATIEAKPGATIVGAELEQDDGVEMYEVTVEQGGTSYEIDVTPAGVVLEVEEDDDTGDTILLVLGWVLVIVSPLGAVVAASKRFSAPQPTEA